MDITTKQHLTNTAFRAGLQGESFWDMLDRTGRDVIIASETAQDYVALTNLLRTCWQDGEALRN